MADRPSAPPLTEGNHEGGPTSAQQASTSEYGLPSGYQAQYAGDAAFGKKHI